MTFDLITVLGFHDYIYGFSSPALVGLVSLFCGGNRRRQWEECRGGVFSLSSYVVFFFFVGLYHWSLFVW